MIAHSPGYPTDNNRQPDGKGRSWKKQRGSRRGSWDEEALRLGKCNLYIRYSNTKYNNYFNLTNMTITSPNGIYLVFLKFFLSKYFKITDLGKLKHILGILVSRDCLRHFIYLNQAAYIQWIIIHFSIEGLSLVFTPLAIKHSLLLSQLLKTKAEKRTYQNYTSYTFYLSLVSSLLFATQTCPDIQFAVGLVAQFGSNTDIVYYKATKHILYYLKETVNYNLVLERQREGKFDLIR